MNKINYEMFHSLDKKFNNELIINIIRKLCFELRLYLTDELYKSLYYSLYNELYYEIRKGFFIELDN